VEKPKPSIQRDDEKEKELISSLKKLRLSKTTQTNTTKGNTGNEMTDLKQNNEYRTKGDGKENINIRKSVEKKNVEKKKANKN